MFNIQNPVQNSIFLYMILILALLYTKPNFLFNKKGKLKSFGCNNDKTLINFPIFVIGCSIIIYIFFTIINKISYL